jgi:hypothetical protein
MKQLKVGELNRIHDVQGLEEYLETPVLYDIGARGGNLGVRSSFLCEALNIREDQLPHNYGVFCNYLGGGVRGAISGSGYDRALPTTKQRILDALARCCERAYKNLEAETFEVNEWDEQATEAARRAGTVSAY